MLQQRMQQHLDMYGIGLQRNIHRAMPTTASPECRLGSKSNRTTTHSEEKSVLDNRADAVCDHKNNFANTVFYSACALQHFVEHKSSKRPRNCLNDYVIREPKLRQISLVSGWCPRQSIAPATAAVCQTGQPSNSQHRNVVTSRAQTNRDQVQSPAITTMHSQISSLFQLFCFVKA